MRPKSETGGGRVRHDLSRLGSRGGAGRRPTPRSTTPVIAGVSVSLSVRLFANMLAGHLIILFMAGGLAILLGTAAIGVFLLPLGWAIYLFEVGLVATLQAFIFATLSAIYIGGSVAESH